MPRNEVPMIRAIVFDNSVYSREFATLANVSGVKAAAAMESGLRLSEVYARCALEMEVPCEDCLLVASSLEALKEGRTAKMTCCFVGSASEMDAILCGADMVFESLSAFPAFSSVEEFDSVVESSRRAFYDRTIIGQMLEGALSVMDNAYAPYSKFHVGAVLRTDSGNLYRGCNVENASFGGTICAERGAAMASIAAEGKVRYNMIAIASDATDPAPPCLICRQFLSEFTPSGAQVYLVSRTSGVIRHYNFGTLAPYTFTEF